MELTDEMISLATGFARKAHRRIPSIEFDDFRQELLLAAWLAASKYDPTHGASMKTYLSIRLNYAISDIAREYGPYSRYVWAEMSEEEKEEALPVSISADGEEALSVGREETGYRHVEATVAAEQVLKGLRRVDAEVLRLYYLKGRTLLELGRNVYGITESGVSLKVKDATRRAQLVAA